jgi:hypothetical protein
LPPQRQPHPSVAGIGAQEAAAAIGTVSVIQAIARQMIGAPAQIDPVAASRAAPLDVADIHVCFWNVRAALGCDRIFGSASYRTKRQP